MSENKFTEHFNGKMKEVRTHFHAVDNKAIGSIAGMMEQSQLKGAVREMLPFVVGEMINARKGGGQDAYGNPITAKKISLDQALSFAFGKDAKAVFEHCGMGFDGYSLLGLSSEFGMGGLNTGSLQDLYKYHRETTMSGFDATSDQIDSSFRFLIPELIINAIRIGYEGNAFYPNWIASEIALGNDDETTMPQIRRGNAIPMRVKEGSTVPIGNVQFGQKKASVFKTGIGFGLTDELIRKSNLNQLSLFLQQVGIDMTIGTDIEARRVLINGEQASNAESAPVVGTESGTAFAYKDILRMTARSRRLRRPYSRIIANEDNAIDLKLLSEIKGFDGTERLTNLAGNIVNFPATYQTDIFDMSDDDQIMFIDPQSAMVKLNWIPMTVETQRDIKTQEEVSVITDHVGFAVLRRDGRLLLDKGLAFSSNGFPSYMDIDTRLNTEFDKLQ